ncbi:Chitin deacetylase [Pseudonocardia dioxanivorans CB1190]|uniref:Chitin deacetylase n=1 Tax=Pseudonocardia dioxanivorans (strain ATCC 55486 / DSM 44775 / JCM 13855 / CB1190) TaxID=675635 RepID=F4CUM4_PSEUX|nr:polysaccharide deacetylase family protein [Pseudonocardia dioxanivorans]AEA26338.1 Chitin deacetylase [Pseudonocardia dioxanivorans CB1190]
MTLQFTEADVPGPRRDLIGYGATPPAVEWPGGAKIAVSIVVNAEEGSEISWAAGDARNEGLGEIPYGMPAEYRDLCVESIYEYGARAGVWRLLRLFEEYRVPTTFYAAAVAFEQNPELAKAVVGGGHEVCSHGWRWEEPWVLSREEEREHMAAAIASFERTCGTRPVGWYCRYGPSVHTRELLVEEGGFLYDSDAYNDDLPYYVSVGDKRQLVVPYTMVYNDVKYAMPPGMASPTDFFDVCRRGFDELLREGRAGRPRMMSIGLHPRWAGQAGRTSALREFIEHAQRESDVWFATREQIARFWLENHPDEGAA